MKIALGTGATQGIADGANATRSVEEGADTIVWLAKDGPHNLTGKFVKDRKELSW